MKTHRMFTALLLAGAVLLADPARAAISGGVPSPEGPEPQQTERFSKTVPLARGGTFDLSNISGSIVITGGAGDQVVIEAVKRSRTAEDLKVVTIEVTAVANRVEVRTRYPEGRRNISVSVDYTVTVPRAAAVNVKSISGDEKVSGVGGELHASTVSGSVSVASAGDARTVASISGDVHISASKSTGSLNVNSVSGTATLKDVTAAEIRVNTISGDAGLDQVTSTRVSAKSISGEVGFGGPLAPSGRYELTSHSGNVKVAAGDKAGFEVTASTFSGTITSELTLTSKFGGDAGSDRARGRGRMRQTLQGTYGDGSAVLQLNSFSGDIRIVKK